MPSSYTRTYVDQSNEKSAFTAWVQQINAANYTNITDTLLPALGAALDTLSGGAPVRVTVQATNLALPNSFEDADGGAQRELKWLVSFVDLTNGKRSRVEIPIAIPGLTASGTDRVDITQEPFATFVSAFEAVGRTIDGNTLRVDEIRIVGRNL